MMVPILKPKGKNGYSKMSGNQSVHGSFTIRVTTLCIAIFAVRQAQILLAKQFVTGKKKCKLEILVCHIKVRNMKNVSVWYQEKPIPQPIAVNHLQGQYFTMEIELRIKFNTAFVVAKEEMPFTRFRSLLLQRKKWVGYKS